MKNRYSKTPIPELQPTKLSTLSFVLTNRDIIQPMRRGEFPPLLVRPFRPIVAAEQGDLPPGYGLGKIVLDFEDDNMSGNVWLEDLPPCTLVLATTAPKESSLWQFVLDVQDEAGGPEDPHLAMIGQCLPPSLPWLAYHVPPKLLKPDRLQLLLRLHTLVWALGWASLDRIIESQARK